MSVKELKAEVRVLGLDARGCIEKADFVALVSSAAYGSEEATDVGSDSSANQKALKVDMESRTLNKLLIDTINLAVREGEPPEKIAELVENAVESFGAPMTAHLPGVFLQVDDYFFDCSGLQGCQMSPEVRNIISSELRVGIISEMKNGRFGEFMKRLGVPSSSEGFYRFQSPPEKGPVCEVQVLQAERAEEEMDIFTTSSGQSYKVSKCECPPGHWKCGGLSDYKITELGAEGENVFSLKFPETGPLNFPDLLVEDRREIGLQGLLRAFNEKRGLDQHIAAVLAVLNHELARLQALPAYKLDVARSSDEGLPSHFRAAAVCDLLDECALFYASVFHLHFICDRVGIIGNERYAPVVTKAIDASLDFIDAHFDRSKFRVLVLMELFAEHIESAWNVQSGHNSKTADSRQSAELFLENAPEWLSLAIPEKFYSRCAQRMAERKEAYDYGMFSAFEKKLGQGGQGLAAAYKKTHERGQVKQLISLGLVLKKQMRIDEAFERYFKAFELDESLRGPIDYNLTECRNTNCIVNNIEILLRIHISGNSDGLFSINFMPASDSSSVCLESLLVDISETPRHWQYAKRVGLKMVRDGALGEACQRCLSTAMSDYGESKLVFDKRDGSLTMVMWERVYSANVGDGYEMDNLVSRCLCEDRWTRGTWLRIQRLKDEAVGRADNQGPRVS